MRLSHPVLRRTRAVRVHIRSCLQAPFTDNRCSGCHRLGHGDVVARTRAGNGFFKTISIHKHIVDGTVEVGAQFQGQFVITQHHKLSRFAECKTCIHTKRTAGTTIIRCCQVFVAVKRQQALIRCQCAHGGVSIDDFRYQWCFGCANNHQPVSAGANVAYTLPQIVEEGGTGGGISARCTQIAKQVGIDKICRHFGKSQRQLF